MTPLYLLAPDGSSIDIDSDAPFDTPQEQERVLLQLGRGSHGVPKLELHVSRVAAELVQVAGSATLRVRVRNRNPLFMTAAPSDASSGTAATSGAAAAPAAAPKAIAPGSMHEWLPGQTLFLLHSVEQPLHYPFLLVARDPPAPSDSPLALSMPDPEATQDVELPPQQMTMTPVVLVVTAPSHEAKAAPASRAPSAAAASAAIVAGEPGAASADPVMPSLSFGIVPSLALDPEDDLPAAAERHAAAAPAAAPAAPAVVISAAAPSDADRPDASAGASQGRSSRKRSHSPAVADAAAAQAPSVVEAASPSEAAVGQATDAASPASDASWAVPAVAAAAAPPDTKPSAADAADAEMADASAGVSPTAAADDAAGPPSKRARLLTIKRSLDSLGASPSSQPPPPFLSGWAVHLVSEGIGARQVEILHSSVVKRGGVLLPDLPRHSFHTTAKAEREARRRERANKAAAGASSSSSSGGASAEPAKLPILILVGPSIRTRKELCEVIARKQRYEQARLDASRAHHLSVPQTAASASSPPSSPGGRRSGSGAASPSLLSWSGSSAASTASAAASAASSVRLRSQWRIVHVNYLVECNKRNALLPTDAFLLDDEQPGKGGQPQPPPSRKLEFATGSSSSAGEPAESAGAPPPAAAAAAASARPSDDPSLLDGSEEDETDSKYAEDDFSSAGGSVADGTGGGLSSPAAISAWNGAIAAQLSETASNYDAQPGEHFRSNAFRRAAGIVRSLPYALRDVSTLSEQRGLGPGTLTEIRTILETGHSARLEALRSDPVLAVHQLLQTVHGVGPKTAAKLYAQGVRSIDDLRKHPKLTAAQSTYLRYYSELRTPIPRGEVAQFEAAIARVLAGIDPRLRMVVCGSYRRGREMVGDIDCLITHPDPDYHYVPSHSGSGGAAAAAAAAAGAARRGAGGSGASAAGASAAPASPTRKSTSAGGKSSFACLLEELVRRLHNAGILTDDLVVPSSFSASASSGSGSGSGSRGGGGGSGSGSGWGRRPSKSRSIYESGLEHEMYGGVGMIPRDEARGWGGMHRRIDLKIYAQTEFPFALLYFTGSKDFNRAMRLYANSRFSYRLSDKSLSPYLRRGSDKIVSGVGIACASEEEIFAALQLEYVEPTQRDVIPAAFLKK